MFKWFLTNLCIVFCFFFSFKSRECGWYLEKLNYCCEQSNCCWIHHRCSPAHLLHSRLLIGSQNRNHPQRAGTAQVDIAATLTRINIVSHFVSPLSSTWRTAVVAIRQRPYSPAWSCFLVGSLTSQQRAGVSRGRICSDSCTCRLTEREVACQIWYLIRWQYTDTGSTNHSTVPITPDAWRGSHKTTSVEVTGEVPIGKAGFDLRPTALKVDSLPLGHRVAAWR